MDPLRRVRATKALALLLVLGLSALPGTLVAKSRAPRTMTISEAGGLGRIEIHDDIAAVLRRDEGIVTLVDLKEPGGPVALGSYSDDADRSLDGDLAFSEDGSYIFYARQTEQFSRDGLHVLDISDLSAPALSTYHPMGGAYRVETYHDGTDEWVFVLDATHGLVVFRFEPVSGQVVPLAIDALPALKVGGPASAGIYIDDVDPQLGVPLMYVTTGETGLQVYDISDPVQPAILGAWTDVGLAEVEVDVSRKGRTVYAATEYWFDNSIEPEVVVLDATDLGAITETDRWSAGGVVDPNNTHRVQGMVLHGGRLLVAHSTLGVIAFGRTGKIASRMDLAQGRFPGPKATVLGEPYAYDVESWKNLVLISDAASGDLTIAKHSSI